MRLAYVSDQKFYSWGGEWYTTASFPLDRLHVLFPFVDEWIVYGRLYNLREKPRELFPIPVPSPMQVRFEGPLNMATGFRGYVGSSLSYLHKSHKTIVSSDIVWLKLPFVAPIACLATPARGRIIFCQMVGDPEVAGAELGSGVKVASFIYSRLVKLIVSRCTFSVFVSRYLAVKYHCPGSPWLVANESRITEQMIASSGSAQVHSVPRILYVGRLSPEKGLTTLFSALAILRQTMGFEAWIVGSGDQLSELRVLAERLGITENVKFLGRVPWGDQLFRIVRDSDVLVLPSRTEGLPLVVIEALSQGVPVVASAVGGIPEIVTDGVSGLLVPSGSVTDLAAALTKILTDQILRAKLIAGGLEVARWNTFERQTGKIANVVERLIAHDYSVLASLAKEDWH